MERGKSRKDTGQAGVISTTNNPHIFGKEKLQVLPTLSFKGYVLE